MTNHGETTGIALFETETEGYVFVRLAVALFILGSAIVGAWHEPVSVGHIGFKISVTACALMGVSALCVRRYKGSAGFVWSQVGLDTVFITALIAVSSGPQTPYVWLYTLSIIFTARLLSPIGIIVAAVIHSVSFCGVSVLGLSGGLSWVQDQNVAILSTHVLICIIGLLIVGLLGMGLVSQRGRVDEVSRLHHKRKDHSELLDQLQIGIVTLTDGIVVAMNASARGWFGETVGQTADEIFPCQSHRWDQPLIGQGPERWLECIRHIVDDDEQVIVIQDVTDLRALELQVEREERLTAVGRLSASLAHEVRNPLASLSGSVQLLASKGENPLHDIILREVHRLNALVEDFLQFSGPLQMHPLVVCPIQTVQDVVQAFKNDPRCATKTVNIKTEPGGKVSLDTNRFRQVLWNLLINAAQAIEDKGTIDVTARHTHDWFVVIISDDGVGIEPTNRHRIFDPFYTSRRKGTGLGLATVDRIVAAHGGAIEVRSEVGIGSEFEVRLPRLVSSQGGEKTHAG